MNIKRMLLLASMALAAIAFAAPAVAQGEITLTEGQTKLGQDAEFTATSTNLETHTEAGVLACGHVALDLKLLDPGTDHLIVDDVTPATTEGCHLQTPEETFFLVTEDMTIDATTIDTWGHGTAPTTLVSHVFADPGHTITIASCHFTGSLTLEATTPDILDVHGTLEETAGEETCPVTTTTITGTFTLDTPGGDPVNVNFTHTP